MKHSVDVLHFFWGPLTKLSCFAEFTIRANDTGEQYDKFLNLKIVRALSLVYRCVQMRVCKHGPDLTLSVLCEQYFRKPIGDLSFQNSELVRMIYL